MQDQNIMLYCKFILCVLKHEQNKSKIHPSNKNTLIFDSKHETIKGQGSLTLKSKMEDEL